MEKIIESVYTSTEDRIPLTKLVNEIAKKQKIPHAEVWTRINKMLHLHGIKDLKKKDLNKAIAYCEDILKNLSYKKADIEQKMSILKIEQIEKKQSNKQVQEQQTLFSITDKPEQNILEFCQKNSEDWKKILEESSLRQKEFEKQFTLIQENMIKSVTAAYEIFKNNSSKNVLKTSPDDLLIIFENMLIDIENKIIFEENQRDLIKMTLYEILKEEYQSQQKEFKFQYPLGEKESINKVKQKYKDIIPL